MELREYLRTLKRRWWILILIPALVVGASLALTVGSANGYVTTGTVSSPVLAAGSATAQYAVDFQAVADSGSALGPVAAATKLSTDTLSQALAVARVSTSNLMQITYTTTDHNPALATKVTQTYGQAILDSVYSATVAQAKAQKDAADAAVAAGQKSVATAKQAVNDFLAANAYVRPDDALRTATTDLGTIQTQLDLAAVSGDSATALTAALDGAKKRLTDLGAKAVQFTSLENEVTKAENAVDSATTDQTTAAKAVEAAAPRGTVSITSLEKVATSQTLQRAVAAGVIGLVLAIVLVLVLDVRRSRGRLAQPGPDSGGPGGGGTLDPGRERELSARA